MSSAYNLDRLAPGALAASVPTRASAVITLSELAIGLTENAGRHQLCAAALIERCARTLGVELHHVSALVARELSRGRMSNTLTAAVDRYRHSPIIGSVERDLAGYRHVVQTAVGRSRTAVLDLVEALVGSGRVDWAAEEARALAGTDRHIANDMIERGIRRDRRGGKHDRFVGDLTGADSPTRFDPSLPLVVECVHGFARTRRDDLARAARRAAAALTGREHHLAAGYAVALAYLEEGVDAARRESTRLRTASGRQRALLLALDAALLARKGRDAARLVGLLGASSAALRGHLAILHWLHGRGRRREARRIASRLDLPRDQRTRIIASLGRDRAWIPDLHAPRCSCTSCRLPRLYPGLDRERASDDAGMDRIIASAIRALTAPSPLSHRQSHWFEAGLSGARTPPADVRDPRDIARALFDEGLSLSAKRATRRGVLVRAAKQALATELTRAGSVPAAVLSSRLRSLRNLAGALSARMLSQLLGDHPSSSVWWSRAFEVLCAIAPADAAELVFSDYARIPPDAAALKTLAVAGAISSEFAVRWTDLEHDQAIRRGREPARRWMADLAAAWRSRYGVLPPSDALRIDRWRGVQDARSALAGMERIIQRQLENPPRALVRAATADDELRRSLSVVTPARLPGNTSPWSDDRIRKELEQLLSQPSGVADRQLLVDFLKHLPISPSRRAHVRAELLAGRLPVSPATRDLARGWSVRVLDKRRDLLTFLRFADPVWCCLHSESRLLPTRRRWIADSWHDPLTYCIHIERARAASIQPAGFVLGGFGLVDGAPALILNGVYLRGGGRSAVRAAALAFIEEHVAGPLRIRLIGVAARHGGVGALPDGYAEARRSVLRCRALSFGGPVRRTFDDVSTFVNEPREIDLWWKSLE